MNKTTTHYFEATKKLPLAMSLSQVQKLVAEVGVPPNPPKTGWNFKNIIIMTTSIIAVSTVLILSLNSSQDANYTARKSNLFPNSNQEIGLMPQDSTEKKVTNTIQLEKLERKEEIETITQTKQLNESTIETTETPVLEITPLVLKQEEMGLTEPSEETSIFEPLLSDNQSGTDQGLFTDPGNNGQEESGIEPFDLFDEPEEISELEEKDDKIDGSSKTINKTFDLNKIKWFMLDHSRGDIVIKNANSNQAEMTATITVEGKTKEDEQIAIQDFDLDFNKKGDQLGVKYNWTGDQIGTCFCWSDSKKNKIKTSSGETVRIKKIKIEYEIALPKHINLELTNRYGDITLPDREGELKAVLFKGDLVAGVVGGDLSLSEKYGKAKVVSAQNSEVNLFKGELDLGSAQQVKAKLSYSDLKLGKAIDLNLTSFQSDATINELAGKLSSNFRYGDLNIEKDLNELQLTAFQSKIKAGSIAKSTLNLSYTKLEMNDGEEINLEKAFQSKLSANVINQIKGKGNYSPIKIEKVNSAIDLVTFQGSLNIASIEPGFTKVNLNTRYTNVDLRFNPTTSYNLEAKTSFTSINMPTSIQNLNVNPNNSSSRNHLKGEVNKGSQGSNSLVYIESFQGKLNLQ